MCAIIDAESINKNGDDDYDAACYSDTTVNRKYGQTVVAFVQGI